MRIKLSRYKLGGTAPHRAGLSRDEPGIKRRRTNF
jgi:hypothetical protein